jgi:uncharacterized RDD family membrane protein YckC
MTKQIKFRRANYSNVGTQFWLRTFAFTIDCFVISFLLPLVLIGIGMISQRLEVSLFPTAEDGFLVFQRKFLTLFFAPYIVVFGLYSAFLESSRLQGTIGKWFFGLKVSDMDSKRITLSKAIVRYMLKIISIATIIGVFIIDMTPKRQGFHDIIAGTILTKR